MPWKMCGGFNRQEARRSEEHTSELQSHLNLVCRLLLEKKRKYRFPLESKREHERQTRVSVHVCDRRHRYPLRVCSGSTLSRMSQGDIMSCFSILEAASPDIDSSPPRPPSQN